jgi:hypothetical protein
VTTTIVVYQDEYPPDVHSDTDGTYRVTILDGGHLQVKVAGRTFYYNARVWHSVDIHEEPADG